MRIGRMAARGECRTVARKLAVVVCSRADRAAAMAVPLAVMVEGPVLVLAAAAVALAVAAANTGAVQADVPAPKAWRAVWTSRPTAERRLAWRDFLLPLLSDDANRGESSALVGTELSSLVSC